MRSPVVGELALDLVLGSEVGVLVEAQAVTEEVGDQQAGVAFVGVAGDQVGERLAVAADRRLQAVPGLGFPLRCTAGLGLLRRLGHRRRDITCDHGGGLQLVHEPPFISQEMRDHLVRDEPCPISARFPHALGTAQSIIRLQLPRDDRGR